jgi:hypothetical protein
MLVSEEADTLLCECRNSERKVQLRSKVELEVNFMKNEGTFLVTEGERKVRSYRILCRDEGISASWHVIYIHEKINIQEVQDGVRSHPKCFEQGAASRFVSRC